jgi:hypothetical protein
MSSQEATRYFRGYSGRFLDRVGSEGRRDRHPRSGREPHGGLWKVARLHRTPPCPAQMIVLDLSAVEFMDSSEPTGWVFRPPAARIRSTRCTHQGYWRRSVRCALGQRLLGSEGAVDLLQQRLCRARASASPTTAAPRFIAPSHRSSVRSCLIEGRGRSARVFPKGDALPNPRGSAAASGVCAH